MATLTLAPTRAFVWTGTEAEAAGCSADLAGWHRTTVAPPGSVVFYTGEVSGRPCYNPWAALPFYGIADEAARKVLLPLQQEYEASLALDASVPAGALPDGEHLLPFQKAGVAYALRRDNALIADPMGLGKTVQAIAVLNCRRAERVLVLCPAAVVDQWEKSLRRWLVPFRAGYLDAIYRVGKETKKLHAKIRIVVCSYDRAKQKFFHGLLNAESWDHVVLDESHYLRHHSAARTKAVLGVYKKGGDPSAIIAKAAHILALSGTPLPNRPREAYTIARALDWESISFMSQQAFIERFNPMHTFWAKTRSGQERLIVREATGRLPELQARLRCGFMVRREKALAAPQLPAKIYDVVVCNNDATRQVVRAESALGLSIDDIAKLPMDLQGHVAKLRRDMGFAILPVAQELIESLLAESDEKFVVFAYHLEVIRLLKEHFKNAKPVVVTGATSSVQRVEAVSRFVGEKECRLFIGQIQAAGTGLDGLHTACSNAVFVEPSWVPAENEQAVDRLHRVGQTLPVVAKFLVAEGSISAKIVARYVEKSRVQHAALDARFLAA